MFFLKGFLFVCLVFAFLFLCFFAGLKISELAGFQRVPQFSGIPQHPVVQSIHLSCQRKKPRRLEAKPKPNGGTSLSRLNSG